MGTTATSPASGSSSSISSATGAAGAARRDGVSAARSRASQPMTSPSPGSATGEARSALLQEGLHALALIVAAEEARERLGLELAGRREALALAAQRDPLGRGDG